MTTEPVKLRKVTEAATMLTLSRAKVYLMMDAGELAYVKLGRQPAHSAVRDR